MRTLLTFIFVSISVALYCQDKPVIIEKEQKGSKIYLKAVNTSDRDYSYTLTITSSGFDLSRESPVYDKLGPGESGIAVILTARAGEEASYQYSLTPHPAEEKDMITTEVQETQRSYRVVVANSAKHHAEKAGRNVENHLDPEVLTLFVRNDCDRCSYVTEYLDAFDLEYQVLNVTTNIQHNELMWDALYVFGKKEGRVILPVITQHKKIYYSISDLEAFVRDLVGK